MALTALVDRIDRRDADALTLAHDTPSQLGHTDHCDRPCQTRWAGLTTGEHDFAVVDPTGREHCAHCRESGALDCCEACAQACLRAESMEAASHGRPESHARTFRRIETRNGTLFEDSTTGRVLTADEMEPDR